MKTNLYDCTLCLFSLFKSRIDFMNEKKNFLSIIWYSMITDNNKNNSNSSYLLFLISKNNFIEKWRSLKGFSRFSFKKFLKISKFSHH